MSDLSTFLAKASTAVAASQPRGRLLFTLDATGSRQAMWSMTKPLTQNMLAEAAKIGTLDVSIGFFRGFQEANFAPWTDSAAELSGLMDQVHCASGSTQIGKLLDHAIAEHGDKPISAMVFIGDTVEEDPDRLYAKCRHFASASPRLPLFIFHEVDEHAWDREESTRTMKRMCEITGGAYAPFTEGSAAALRDLLNAIAAFATGGLKALAGSNTEAARLLLTQIRA